MSKQQTQQPVAWVRFCSDGCYEGPIMDSDPRMDGCRRTSGAWTPLFTSQPMPRDVLMAAMRDVLAACSHEMKRAFGLMETFEAINLADIADRYASKVQTDGNGYGAGVVEASLRAKVNSMIHDIAVAKCEIERLRTQQPEPVNQQMLAALKAVLQWIDDWCETGPNMDFERVEAEADAAIAAAEAAQPVGLHASKFFAYDDETGFDLFDTAEEAKKAAQDSIDEYRHEAGEGWPEEVENVCWGVVLGATKEAPLVDSEGNSTDWAGDKYVDYVLADCQQPASAQPVAVPTDVGNWRKVVEDLLKDWHDGTVVQVYHGKAAAIDIATNRIAAARAMLSAAQQQEGGK
ncbi:hypothetical protein [Vogesella oryzae]|uniref:hypothetical protein n=1 Tax=Vogesella oryzae TaxID=1735285 RepID=UPI001583F177|nr:hypothetical protein [Vogesella oryzae]